eukprot:Sdes_comp11110_c0_seq1m2704
METQRTEESFSPLQTEKMKPSSNKKDIRITNEVFMKPDFFVTSSLETTHVTLYRRRFFMLFIYALLNGLLGFLWLTYTPIIRASSKFYGESETKINMFSQIYFVVFIPGIFFVNWFLATYGVRITIIVGCVSILVGSWLRYFAGPVFWLGLLGQTLNAVALSFTFSLPPKVAADWFPEMERVFATSFCVIINQLGSAGGAILPGLIINSYHYDIHSLLLLEAVIATIIIIPNIIFYRSLPPTSPSVSSGHKAGNKNPKVYPQILLLLKNTSFLVLFLIQGFCIGSYAAMLAIINQALPVGTNSFYVGVASFIFQLSGIPGVILLIPVLSKIKKYKYTLSGFLFLLL